MIAELWVAACVAYGIQLEEYSRHNRLAECHMSITERSLTRINQQCYCIGVDDEFGQSQRGME